MIDTDRQPIFANCYMFWRENLPPCLWEPGEALDGLLEEQSRKETNQTVLVSSSFQHKRCTRSTERSSTAALGRTAPPGLSLGCGGENKWWSSSMITSPFIPWHCHCQFAMAYYWKVCHVCSWQDWHCLKVFTLHRISAFQFTIPLHSLFLFVKAQVYVAHFIEFENIVGIISVSLCILYFSSIIIF